MSWNQQLGKKLNKEMILKKIISDEYVSRNDIITLTGLNKATVANLVNELIEEKLVIEVGKEQSSGGRRPRILSFNNHAGYVLALDIGVNYLKGAIIDLQGNLILEHTQPVTETDFETYFKKICTLIKTLEEAVPNCPYNIIGLGIAVPGIINTENIIVYAPNLHWRNINLIENLRPFVDYPVFINNEANAGAYGEYIFTHKRLESNLLFLSIGIGIGAGVIVNDLIYEGAHGFAGESGHMMIHIKGKPCTCGKSGCWEAYASEYACIEAGILLTQNPSISFEELIELANKGNRQIRHMFKEIGEYIGYGVASLIQTLNPSKIIIGNRMSQAQHLIEQSIVSSIKESTTSYHFEKISLEFSNLKEQAIILGAASFAIDKFINLSDSQ